MPDRKLRVFLCHASQDKPVVRELYQRLIAESWVDPWLDEEKLFPGQDWDMEIEKAVESSDVVIVCLSSHSITKEGYVQKELRFVLDISDEKPEDTIFIVPIRLDECPLPRRLKKWQYVDYFPAERKTWALSRVWDSLSMRAQSINITVQNSRSEAIVEIETLMDLFRNEDNNILFLAQTTLRDGDIQRSMRQYALLIEKGAFPDIVLADLEIAKKEYPKEVIIWQMLGDAYKRALRENEANTAYNTAKELSEQPPKDSVTALDKVITTILADDYQVDILKEEKSRKDHLIMYEQLRKIEQNELLPYGPYILIGELLKDTPIESRFLYVLPLVIAILLPLLALKFSDPILFFVIYLTALVVGHFSSRRIGRIVIDAPLKRKIKNAEDQIHNNMI